MKRILLFVTALLFVATTTAAQKKRTKRLKGITTIEHPAQESHEEIVADSVMRTVVEREVDIEAYNNSLTIDYSLSQMDSLLSVWRSKSSAEHFSMLFERFVNIDEQELKAPAASLPDSVLSRRLIDMVSPINLPYNDIVKGYISRYTSARYGTIKRIMSLSQYYFPIFEEALLRHGLPVEFCAMPVIESALSATALSPMGAMGLWQFMPSTGKSYGLEINSLVDQRCDVEASTEAACRFLKDLYAIYNDWSLVIAAYNCGPGNVNKAMARSGVKRGTFWDIYYFLPRETRGYVPAFIGASYAFAYHKHHGIEYEPSPIPLATDTIRVNRLMHLGQISETLELPMDILRQLNPQYRKDIIPATTKEYTLRLPQRYVVKYIENQAEIHSKDSAYLKEYISPAVVRRAQSTMGNTVHVVKSGDTLGAIARKYRVSVRQIMSWNGMRNADKISIGQKLRIEGR